MALTELQARQVEYLSMLKRVINGSHEDFWRYRWGDRYEENIKALESAYYKLLKQLPS